MTYSATHERIYALNGKLIYVDITRPNAYKVPATDVRFIKFRKEDLTVQLKWQKGAKVSDLVTNFNADFGINAPFFWQGNPVADCISDGQILSTGYDNEVTWHGFAVKNGVVGLGKFDINDGHDVLVKTTPYLIDNGNPAWDYFQAYEVTAQDIGRDANGNLIRAERTFIGTDSSGNIIIAASDGRTKTDRGLTLEEMALYMIDKGATNALNFDGGSSTTLADRTGMLNAQPGGEAVVNHALLFFINVPPVAPVTDPNGSDWKQLGMNYLVSDYGLDATQWTPTSPVDIGTLGTILKHKDGK